VVLAENQRKTAVARGEEEEKKYQRGRGLRRLLGEEIDLGFPCYFLFSNRPPSPFQFFSPQKFKIPPFWCVLKATIYRQNVVWPSKLVLQLLFFVKF
jgi:hypothetical protein